MEDTITVMNTYQESKLPAEDKNQARLYGRGNSIEMQRDSPSLLIVSELLLCHTLKVNNRRLIRAS